MKTIIYCVPAEKDRKRKLRLKLPNYLIRRKILILREKIIARKYAEIYLRKVFGKYHPSECVRYYKKNMLKKCFEKLRDNWFEERQVHRLLTKANTFFDAKLSRRYFDGWRRYARRVKIIREKASTVRYNRDKRTINDTLYRWRRETYRRKKYRIMKSQAIELCYLMHTLRLLLEIAKYFSEQIEMNLVEIKAIIYGKFIILRKYTRRWKIYTLQQRDERTLIGKADDYYRSKISVSCFVRWVRYVSHKRTKHEIIQLCRGLYEDGLLKTVLQMWKKEARSKIIEKKQLLQAVKFHDNSVQRKLLRTWKRYVKHKLMGRNLKHKASFFYTMRLKQKALDALSKNVNSCKNTRLAIQKLKLFYRRLILANVFDKWTEMIDEKNDSELRSKLSVAKSFYKENVMRKHLSKWVEYNYHRQRKKTLTFKAFDLCKTFYYRKYLDAWKIAYTKKRRIAALEEKATQFLNKSVMQDAIMRWIISYNNTISMKKKYEESVLHHEKKICSKCFDSWIKYCNERIRGNNLLNEATEYYLESLKRKTLRRLSTNVVRMRMKREKIRAAEDFCEKNLTIVAFENWKEYCLRVKEMRKRVDDFEINMRNRLKRKMIVEWRAYVHHKKCSRRKTSTSVIHRRKKVCAKVFERLKMYVSYRRAKKDRLTYMNSGVEEIKENLKTIYFQKWRVARLNILKEKSRMFHAEQFHEFSLKKRHFITWQKFLMQHKVKRKHQQILNKRINCFILRRCLSVWYARYETLLKNHVNESCAIKIYEIKVKYKYFTGWKYFAEICAREKKEINDAAEIHKKLIIKEGLQYLVKIFLSNTESRFENHLSNHERNSSQDFELRRKYFNKWHRAVLAGAKNRSLLTEGRTTGVEPIDQSGSKVKDRKHVSDLIPRFIIPKSMKDEIKLRFGVGHHSGKSQSDDVQKLSENMSHREETKKPRSSRSAKNDPIKLKNNYDNYQTFARKVPSHRYLRLTVSPDGLRSDSDSAKTYKVQSPKYSCNLGKENSADIPNCSELASEKQNGNVKYRLLPPAAFYVPLKE